MFTHFEHLIPWRQVPDSVVTLGVSAIRKSVMSRANFDIRNVNPLARCPRALQPAVFAHGTLDEIVALHHGESLFQVRRAAWLRWHVSRDHERRLTVGTRRSFGSTARTTAGDQRRFIIWWWRF